MHLTQSLMLSLAVGLAFVGPTAADPSLMYGSWVSLDQQCVYGGGVPSSAAFTISRDKLVYFETSCDVISTPQVGNDGYSVSYTVRCADDATRTAHFSLGSDDHLTVTDNG